MKNMFRNIILLLMCGVFGDTGEEKMMSVMEGDSVILHTDTDIQKAQKIEWRFGEAGSLKLIVEMKENKIRYFDFTDGRYKDRLQISDSKTGSLTIKNMRIKHSGRYEAEISTDAGSTYKRFRVTVKESAVIDAGTDDVSVSVMEGESVTLLNDIQTQRDDLILWRFGDKGVLIAKADKEGNKISLYDGDEGRFKDRLQLDDQTGSLTITHSRISDSGAYKLKIISSIREPKYKIFSVSVRGLSPGAVAGICVSALLVIAAAGVFFYLRYQKISEEKKLLDDRKTVSVMEGCFLNLHTGVTVIQSDDVIQWRFRGTVIAEITRKKMKIYTDDDVVQRFRDRLKLNDQTGDLTISNIRHEDTGDYKLKIITSGGTLQSLFMKLIGRGTSESWFKVIVKDYMKTVSVMEGRPVFLPTGVTVIQSDDDVMQWRFGETLIAEITRKKMKIYTDDDDVQRFRDRLELNDQTGDLIISDIRTEDAGRYNLKIITSRRISESLFRVVVTDKVKTVSVMEGYPVTLSTGVTDIQSDDVIQWRFKETLIAEINSKEKISTDDADVQRFRGRLKLNEQTGALTISNIRPEDAGDYKLKIITSEGTSQSVFNVDVKENMRLVSVMKGDSLFLFTGVNHIQSDDVIQWRFRETLIAEIKGKEMKIPTDDDDVQRFRGRLELNVWTGALIIRDSRTEDAGDYKQKIITSEGTSETLFRVTVWVMKGDSLFLPTGVTVIQSYDVIQWRFGETLIAEIKRKKVKISTDDDDVQRFRDRLELNDQTGDLTIRDSRTEHTGRYKLKIITSGGTSESLFYVDVWDRLTVVEDNNSVA